MEKVKTGNKLIGQVLLSCLIFAPALAWADRIVDNFNRPNGSPPNPAIWVQDHDCDMTDVSITVQNSQLSQFGVYGNRCLPDGLIGLGVFSRATFSRFDISVQYMGTEGPGFGYGFFGVFDATHLPPGSSENFIIGPTIAGFNFANCTEPGRGCGSFSAVWERGQQQIEVGVLNVGDILRLVGKPGKSLVFYQNGVQIFSVRPWLPRVEKFVAILYSRPGGTLGESRRTFFDNFRGKENDAEADDDDDDEIRENDRGKVLNESVFHGLPEGFNLGGNYPNPFNARTTISYSLPAEAEVNLDIYNITGQKVRTLVNKRQTAGYKTVMWDGRDESGQPVSSGIYIYRIEAGEYRATKKMTLLK